MDNKSFTQRLRDVSIAKKLYFTVGVMALLIAVELITLMFAIQTLSSVRTYVGAEGLWSKAQKDAVYSLRKYGASHDEKDYAEYLEYLKVNVGDHKARAELLKPHPDLNVVRQGFLEGRVHPDDIDGAINLVTRFYKVDYIARAITAWAKGDVMISELQRVGDKLHAEINSTSASNDRVAAILKEIDPLNDKLTPIEDEFSYTLSEGSRWLTDLISKLLLGLVLTVEISGLSITIFVSRGISRGLNEIIRSADIIAKGNFNVRTKAFSRDEIGVLAGAFNDMADQLERNISLLKRSEEDLNKSKELAEQAVVTKDHFLANMSHEIRTPMNAIIGFTNLLEGSTLDEEQKEFVNAIKVSGQNLTAIINDILDYSKIKAGMVVLERIPISPRTAINSTYVLLLQKAQEKNIDFTYEVADEIPEFVIGDPTRLTQILSNLVDNALKFTTKGSVRISAALDLSVNDSYTITFVVKDTGKGIPKDKQAMIFERFTQASAETSRQHGGTGLGLSIVKSLVSLHDGAISVQSEVGKGAAFSFTITFAAYRPANITSPVAIQDVSSGAKTLRILYAEDNTLNQMLVRHFCKNHGFHLDLADNGEIVVEKLKRNEHDLVLMDIQMPVMDGYEATTVIRRDISKDIPIIALTAHAMSGEKEKCLGLGMNDFVTKPFDPKELNAKIRAFFKS